jgi:DNA invertase Pin-like site-specific DNA recombinase
VALARNGKIDVVICRDYDRLARTRALLAQLSVYLSRCQVQIYALDKPIEPLPPHQLGQRGNTIESVATVEGVERPDEEGRGAIG